MIGTPLLYPHQATLVGLGSLTHAHWCHAGQQAIVAEVVAQMAEHLFWPYVCPLSRQPPRPLRKPTWGYGGDVVLVVMVFEAVVADAVTME